MKKIIILFIFTFSFELLFSNENEGSKPTSSLEKNDNYYLNIGILQAENKKFDSSLININKSIEINPKNVFAYYVRATVYYEQGLFEDALKDLNQSVKLNKKDDKSLFLRAVVQQNLKNYEKAIIDYDNLVELNDSTAEYQFNYATCLQESGNSTKAITIYKKFEKQFPTDANFFNNIIAALIDTKNYSEVISYCNLAKTKDLYSDEIIEMHIVGNFLSDNCQESKNIHESIGKNLSQAGELLINIGNCFAKKEDFKNAEKCFNESIKINPSLIENYFQQAIIKIRLKEYQGAIELFEKFLIESKNRTDLIELQTQAKGYLQQLNDINK
jgi:tetratricopeptide (TPR) repeat protein